MTDTGAGESAAGEEPTGEYIAPPAAPARNIKPPKALMFDGVTATNPIDPVTGLYIEVHPVDQAVAMALLFTRGMVKSSPNTGSQLRQIKKITNSTVDQVKNFVNQALATLVATKSITIQRIDVETFTATGAVAVAVSYKNLRTSKPETARTTING